MAIKGFSNQLIEAHRNLLSGTKMAINDMGNGCTDSCCSKPVKTTVGTPQGSILSPKEFIIYIDDLLEQYSRSGIEARAFADDIVCVLNNQVELERAIDITTAWSRENAIDINKKKSGVMAIRKDRRTKPFSSQCTAGNRNSLFYAPGGPDGPCNE